MSGDDSGVLVEYEWQTAHDDLVCPICGDMDGYVWQSLGTVLEEILVHPKYGLVWDFKLGQSFSHDPFGGEGGHYCRCRVDIRVKILYGGEYVDYQEAEAVLANIDAMNDRLARTGLGDTESSPMETNAGAISGGISVYQVRRMLSLPRMVQRMASGNMSTFDIYQATRMSGIGNLLGAAGPYALIAAYLIPMVIREIQRILDEMNRPALMAQAYVQRQTEREYFKQWSP